jgi:hypothetical protein
MLEPRTGGAAKRNLNIFASAAIPRIVCLERAFSFEDENLMAVAVGGLVGLGPGLTPSSDDMLAGLVLMCVLYTRSRGSLQRASQLISQATYAESRGRTTLLSEECLRQAALGRGNEPVARLCEALLTARPIVVERATKHVLKIGETSGTDTTLGVVMGTMLCTGMPFGLSASESE